MSKNWGDPQSLSDEDLILMLRYAKRDIAFQRKEQNIAGVAEASSLFQKLQKWYFKRELKEPV